MLRSKGLSIRKKLLVSILTFSVLLVMLVTMLAVFITYNTMRDQLIYNCRMSIGWLQDRLNFKIKNFTSQFYEFEVNKEIPSHVEPSYSNDLENPIIYGDTEENRVMLFTISIFVGVEHIACGYLNDSRTVCQDAVYAGDRFKIRSSFTVACMTWES